MMIQVCGMAVGPALPSRRWAKWEVERGWANHWQRALVLQMAVGEAGRFMEHVVTKEPYSMRRSPRWAGVEGLDGCGVQPVKLSWQADGKSILAKPKLVGKGITNFLPTL